jgi:predicted RecB family nuclease
MKEKGDLRTCSKGHEFYKSSDCPACPVCEVERKPKNGFLSTLGAPARRALESKGIMTVEKLAGYSQAEILNLHGIGASTIPKLQEALARKKLNFRK